MKCDIRNRVFIDNNDCSTKESNSDKRKRKKKISKKSQEPATPEPKRRSKRVRLMSAKEESINSTYNEMTN